MARGNEELRPLEVDTVQLAGRQRLPPFLQLPSRLRCRSVPRTSARLWRLIAIHRAQEAADCAAYLVSGPVPLPNTFGARSGYLSRLSEQFHRELRHEQT